MCSACSTAVAATWTDCSGSMLPKGMTLLRADAHGSSECMCAACDVIHVYLNNSRGKSMRSALLIPLCLSLLLTLCNCLSLSFSLAVCLSPTPTTNTNNRYVRQRRWSQAACWTSSSATRWWTRQSCTALLRWQSRVRQRRWQRRRCCVCALVCAVVSPRLHAALQLLHAQHHAHTHTHT